MTTHLVDIPIDLRALNHWAGQRGLFRNGPLDEGVAMHHLLGEVFGSAALQPFRLMVAPRAHHGTLFAYARQDADHLAREAESTLAPADASVIDLKRMRSLPRPSSTWRIGQRLGFDIRVRPVVRLHSDLHGRNQTFRKGAEIDAYLAEALRTNSPRSRDEVYLEWLTNRFAPAVTLETESVRVASVRRNRIHRKGKILDGPDLIVHGTLIIGDPVVFANRLCIGIGRHRSYGYGMLLLRPAMRKAA